MKELLLENVTADGDGENKPTWPGGIPYFDLTGVPGGATVTISISVGGGYNTNTLELAMTETGVYYAPKIANGAQIKATVSNATGTTNLTLILIN